MKQIPLLQGKVLLIELPEGATNTAIAPRTSEQQELIYNMPNTLYALTGAILPPGNWRIIGMLSEVTEGQADEIVSKVINGQHFQNYAFTTPVNRWVKTALESLESAIIVEGWYFENPLENERNKIGLGTLDNFDQDYEQTQSRVLDRSRCLLLGRDGV